MATTPTAADGRRPLTPGSVARAAGTTAQPARTPSKGRDGGMGKAEDDSVGPRLKMPMDESIGSSRAEKSASEPTASPANNSGDHLLNRAYLDARLGALQEQLLVRMSKVERNLDEKLGALFDLFDKQKDSFNAGNVRAPESGRSLTSRATLKQSGSPFLNKKSQASNFTMNGAGKDAVLSESEPEILEDCASESSSTSPSAELVANIPDGDFDDDESNIEKAPLVLIVSDDWMINPRKHFRMSWDLCVLYPLLLYLTIVMPFRMTFSNEAEVFSSM